MNVKKGLSLETEQLEVEKRLRNLFASANDIYIDPIMKECEVKVDVEEFNGQIKREIFEDSISLVMVDYSDIFPYKYVFQYRFI